MTQKSQFSQSGVGMILIFLSVVIIASLFLVGGIIPGKSKNNNKDFTYSAVIDTPGDSKKTLQLKTIKFKSCGTDATVDFLVDRSGSMNLGTKLVNLRSGLRVFADSFPEEGVIGMQTFSGGLTPDSRNITADVPFDYFKNNKTQFVSSIINLFPDGGTSTKDAFVFAKTQLDLAKQNFPDRKYTLVFISDGIPETLKQNTDCPSDTSCRNQYCAQKTDFLGNIRWRCFDPNQDPTPIAAEIKASGVRIFTIGYVDDTEAKFNTELTALMKRVATAPEDFYPAPITGQLTTILQSITTKICKDEK